MLVIERTSDLQKSLSVTRGTLESAADGIIVISKDNHLIDYNNKFTEMWSISPDMIESDDANKLFEYIKKQLVEPAEFSMTLKNLSETNLASIKNEKLKCTANRTFEYYTQPYKLNSENAGRVWSFRDITQRALLETELEHQATHDALTGFTKPGVIK